VAPPQTPLGELTALPRHPSWVKGGLLLKGRRGGEGKFNELVSGPRIFYLFFKSIFL